MYMYFDFYWLSGALSAAADFAKTQVAKAHPWIQIHHSYSGFDHNLGQPGSLSAACRLHHDSSGSNSFLNSTRSNKNQQGFGQGATLADPSFLGASLLGVAPVCDQALLGQIRSPCFGWGGSWRSRRRSGLGACPSPGPPCGCLWQRRSQELIV